MFVSVVFASPACFEYAIPKINGVIDVNSIFQSDVG